MTDFDLVGLEADADRLLAGIDERHSRLRMRVRAAIAEVRRLRGQLSQSASRRPCPKCGSYDTIDASQSLDCAVCDEST